MCSAAPAAARRFAAASAIGDQIVDLAALSAAGPLQGLAAQAARACAQPALNDFMALGPAAWQALRHGLFALLETPSRRAAGMGPARLTRTSFRHQHWTVAQMLAHHTVGGCNLQAGDLLGSGTISGPTASEAGAMMELSHAGRKPVRFEGGSGQIEERGFLADGDVVVFTGWCERPGFARIGFSECHGTVLPAIELPI